VVPEADRLIVQEWTNDRNARLPDHAIGQVRIELDVDRDALTIRECRPPWRDDWGPEWTRSAVARLRYSTSRGDWTLFWRDRHERFHRYGYAAPTPDVTALLAEVDRDPTAIFWG
jgi:Protein of unknown function (DUF3024)